MITATKPFSPPIEDYQLKIAQIFEKNWFTNHGPFVTELELKLKEFFDVPYLAVVSNGTIALQISIKALELNNDEIITTPYSYVATTNSILWENCKPVFVDIDEDTFNIDPSKIEAKINSKTKTFTNRFKTTDEKIDRGYNSDANVAKLLAEQENFNHTEVLITPETLTSYWQKCVESNEECNLNPNNFVYW